MSRCAGLDLLLSGRGPAVAHWASHSSHLRHYWPLPRTAGDKTRHFTWHYTHKIIISDNWKYIWRLLKNYFWHICQVTAMSLQRRASVAGADFKKDYLNRSGERYNLIWILYDKTDLQDNLSKVHHILCPCKIIKSSTKYFLSNHPINNHIPDSHSLVRASLPHVSMLVMTIDCDRPPLSPVLQDVWLLSSSGPAPAWIQWRSGLSQVTSRYERYPREHLKELSKKKGNWELELLA